MQVKSEMKRRKLNLKQYFLIAGLFVVTFLLYIELTQFKSYVNRSQVTPRIAQHCSKFRKNNAQQILRQRRRVGFFLIGTGKYIKFAQQLIESMEKHFCTNSPHIYVHYFIFTDATDFEPRLMSKGYNDGNRNFTNIYQEHLQWPMSTLLRFENIIKVRLKFFFYH